MAVGPDTLPEFAEISGIRIGVASAGIKTPGRKDLVIFELAQGTKTAGVFTQNAFCAAPVVLSKKHLSETSPRYLVINTGNANAGTGSQGLADAQNTCSRLATLANVHANQVLPYSTGVIGEPLPIDKLFAALPSALNDLSTSHWSQAATAIMTTDTRPKGSSRTVDIDGQMISISGISKGAGMICPNMATMLAFVATDAQIDADSLQQLLKTIADKSFNRVTIDGDTSTNDACMLMASGASGVKLTHGSSGWDQFVEALELTLVELAQAIVRDGEGATKFITVAVELGASSEESLKTAYTIAHSPLVKTALFACDPNWGRILAAVGRAGIENFDLDALQIYLNDVCIVEKGGRAASYTEAQGQNVMDQEEILIRVVLNRGEFSEQVWTTDLSHDYVSINADYRS